jgi:hypothetical protein
MTKIDNKQPTYEMVEDFLLMEMIYIYIYIYTCIYIYVHTSNLWNNRRHSDNCDVVVSFPSRSIPSNRTLLHPTSKSFIFPAVSIYTFVYTYIYVYLYIYMYIYIYIHIYIHIYIKIHIYIFTSIALYSTQRANLSSFQQFQSICKYGYIYLYTYVYIHEYICKYTYVNISIYIYIYIHTYTYIYIYIKIHIYIFTSNALYSTQRANI